MLYRRGWHADWAGLRWKTQENQRRDLKGVAEGFNLRCLLWCWLRDVHPENAEREVDASASAKLSFSNESFNLKLSREGLD